MKKVKVLAILVSLAVMVGLSGIASAGTLDEILKRGEIRIACQTQGAPFSFVDKNGKRTGSSVEICNMIAKEMGVKAKYLNYDWDGLIPALLSKKADMLAADMTPTLKKTGTVFSSLIQTLKCWSLSVITMCLRNCTGRIMCQTSVC